MGQLAPSSQRAVRVALSSPNGDDRKPYQASSFKISSGRSMTSPFRMERDGRASACRGTPAKMRSVGIGGCRQFTSPAQRGAVLVGPTLSRAFENRYADQPLPFHLSV